MLVNDKIPPYEVPNYILHTLASRGATTEELDTMHDLLQKYVTPAVMKEKGE